VAFWAGSVPMSMAGVVVHTGVRVLQALVRVSMHMPLGQVQHDARGHASRTGAAAQRERPKPNTDPVRAASNARCANR
jgi:hypothetical protein